jgi:hypothetical protein
MFRRISLTGSAELFRETAPPIEVSEAVTVPHSAASDGGLVEAAETRLAEAITYFGYHLTEEQVRTLADALQKLKYPHTLRSLTRPSMEEFERLEALRQQLLDGLR